MTTLLEKAFQKAGHLPAAAQDTLAQEILDDLADEARWDNTLAQTGKMIDRLAERALHQYQAGKTRPQGFDKL